MPPVTGSDGTPSGFNPNSPFGVWGDSGQSGPFGGGGNGVVGSSAGSSGVAGFTLADNPRAAGVYGAGPSVGIAGAVQGASSAPGDRVGVYGTASNGLNMGGIGVAGISDTGVGVRGDSVSADGMVGFSSTAAGVAGIGAQNIGVFGVSNGTGVLGLGGAFGGYFIGDVHVSGSLSKAGGGFKIDHPLDPTNKYLQHSFVESPERKNIYDGIADCGPDSTVTVALPEWFESLNADFRYQLTPLGGPAPGLYIGAELKGNKFVIAGGSPGLRVSWQVTGVRRDAWATANLFKTEEEKSGKNRGRYLHPKEHGAAPEQGIEHPHHTRAYDYLRKK
jgi:hypothetical protein